MAQAFLTSLEYREATVDNFYIDILGRSRGVGEGAAYVSSGLGLGAIARLFASSDEYFPPLR